MKRLCWRKAAILLAVLSIGACNREEGGQDKKGPIETVKLPTPKTTVRGRDTMGAAAPLAAHTATPIAAPTKAPAAEKGAPSTPAMPMAEARATAAKGTVAPSTATVARAGIVARGTDLRDGPGTEAKILGTFEGRTNVDVIETQGEWSRVRAPVIGGSSVEGWVASSSIKPAGEKPASVAEAAAERAPGAPAKGKAAAPAGGGAGAGAPAAKSAAPAKAAGGKGPETVSLKAIAGMEMKRAAVPFTHKKHWDDYSVKCEDCHHAVKAKGGAVPATKTCTEAGCHQATQCNGQTVAAKNKACPFFEDAFHFNCIECHRAQSGPTKCNECHSG